MDTFLNANNSKNKDLREWNARRSHEEDVVITSSGIPLSKIFVFRVNLHFKKRPSQRDGHTGYEKYSFPVHTRTEVNFFIYL